MRSFRESLVVRVDLAIRFNLAVRLELIVRLDLNGQLDLAVRFLCMGSYQRAWASLNTAKLFE